MGNDMLKDTVQKDNVQDDVDVMAHRILDIIYQYRLTKLEEAHDLYNLGTPGFINVISKYVREGTTIRMCLPAFPWKSANKKQKVLGTLPDRAEELSLLRLDYLCEEIRSVYPPGARLLIISDGLVYNDLFAINDRDVWAYGQDLRAMAARLCKNIEFSRLRELVKIDLPIKLEEIIYVANAVNFRRALLNQFGSEDFDARKLIAEDEDTRLTYCGYCRFLENELRYVFPLSEGRSKGAFQRHAKYVAREMIKRGAAFAGAVSKNFPDHLRLSIHHSTGAKKVSLNLLPTLTSYTTPWHCSVAFKADGTPTSGERGDFEADPNYDLVYTEGRPSYFQERHVPTSFLKNQPLALPVLGSVAAQS